MKANLANRPSIERVRQVVRYDAEAGVVRWLITSGRAIAGCETGCLDKKTGYRRTWLDGFLILNHHIIWALVHGEWPTQLDHRHGKENGDRIENLRMSDQSKNIANVGLLSTNTSGFKGVCFHKDTGRWQAQIAVQKKKIYLGVYKTKEAAADAYAAAARKHFGEFARTENFVKPAAAIPVPKRKGRPTVDEVRDSLSYDPDTGILRWKKALGFRGQIGAIAGRISDGYVRIGLFGKQYPGHVLAWVIMKGVWPTLIIDHEDTNRSNNRWNNLQEITQSRNIELVHDRYIPEPRPIYKRQSRLLKGDP